MGPFDIFGALLEFLASPEGFWAPFDVFGTLLVFLGALQDFWVSPADFGALCWCFLGSFGVFRALCWCFQGPFGFLVSPEGFWCPFLMFLGPFFGVFGAHFLLFLG